MYLILVFIVFCNLITQCEYFSSIFWSRYRCVWLLFFHPAFMVSQFIVQYVGTVKGIAEEAVPLLNKKNFRQDADKACLPAEAVDLNKRRSLFLWKDRITIDHWGSLR